MPYFSASGAATWRPEEMMSMATVMSTSLGNLWVPAAAGKIPKFTSGNPTLKYTKMLWTVQIHLWEPYSKIHKNALDCTKYSYIRYFTYFLLLLKTNQLNLVKKVYGQQHVIKMFVLCWKFIQDNLLFSACRPVHTKKITTLKMVTSKVQLKDGTKPGKPAILE